MPNPSVCVYMDDVAMVLWDFVEAHEALSVVDDIGELLCFAIKAKNTKTHRGDGVRRPAWIALTSREQKFRYSRP